MPQPTGLDVKGFQKMIEGYEFSKFAFCKIFQSVKGLDPDLDRRCVSPDLGSELFARVISRQHLTITQHVLRQTLKTQMKPA